MTVSISELAQKLDRLRADLGAANTALAAISIVLNDSQRQHLLEVMDAAAAKQDEIYAQLPIGVAENQEAVALSQQAQARMCRRLQDANFEIL